MTVGQLAAIRPRRRRAAGSARRAAGRAARCSSGRAGPAGRRRRRRRRRRAHRRGRVPDGRRGAARAGAEHLGLRRVPRREGAAAALVVRGAAGARGRRRRGAARRRRAACSSRSARPTRRASLAYAAAARAPGADAPSRALCGVVVVRRERAGSSLSTSRRGPRARSRPRRSPRSPRAGRARARRARARATSRRARDAARDRRAVGRAVGAARVRRVALLVACRPTATVLRAATEARFRSPSPTAGGTARGPRRADSLFFSSVVAPRARARATTGAADAAARAAFEPS